MASTKKIKPTNTIDDRFPALKKPMSEEEFNRTKVTKKPTKKKGK